MKRVIFALGVLFVFACSKTEIPATPPVVVVKEEAIKFTTSADTLTVTNNIIDTLPISINVSSTLPPSGLLYSIQVVRNDNSQVVYKLDTTLSLSSLVLKISGFTTAAQYNLIVTITSKATSSNTLSKTITLSRFNIKEFISPNGFLNNKPIADWTKPSGNNSFKWWDMDGDGKPDKIYYTMGSNGFILNIYKYSSSSYIKTIDVNDIVINDSLRKFYTNVIQKWGTGESIQVGESLNIVDFNKDSIPDLLFEVGNMEFPKLDFSNINCAYDILLVSKGWLNYEMRIFPTNAHSQMTSSGDFNGDGLPDLWKSSVIVVNKSTGLSNSLHTLTYLNKDYTSKEIQFPSLGLQGDQGTSYISDLDNNGIPDVLIGERDYIDNQTPPIINGTAPRIFMNVNNGNWTKELILQNKVIQAKWNVSSHKLNGTQSIAFFDINNDGFQDIVLNKYSSGLDGTTLSSSDKCETMVQLWINNKDATFTDVTEKWFLNDTYHFYLPLNSAGPFYPPGGGNPNPGDLMTGDVDADGKKDIFFKYYGNIYFKNMGDHFEFQRNDNGFGFISQSYKQPF